MNPKWAEMLDRLGELTQDELEELEKGLTSDFDKLDKESRNPQNVDEMGKVADALDSVRAESDNRASAQEDAERRAEELRGRVHRDEGDEPAGDEPAPAAPAPPAPDTPAPVGDEPAGDEPAGDEPAGDEPADAEDDEDKKPKGIAASGRARTAPRTSTGAITRRNGGKAASSAPKALGSTSRTRSMANSTMAAKFVGDDFDNFDQVVLAMCDRIDSLGQGTGEQFTVARVEVNYPDERKLVNNDPVHNMKVMDRATGIEALTAAGGICTPVDVDYNILVVADDDEPVADSLPSYQAGRGGLRFVIPPTLWGVGTAGTAIWSEATDAASPYPNADGTLPNGTTVKPVQRFVCGTEDEVIVDGIATRFQFGNMMGRFSPEIVEANTRLALAGAARFREVHRLNTIASNSISVSTAQLLGASRDLLATMDQVMAAQRYRFRIARNGVQMRALFPSWAIDMLRADLTRELAHGDDSNLRLTDAEVESLMTSRGWAVDFTLDSQGAGHTGNGGAGLNYADQSWGTTGVNTNPQVQGALLDWPHVMVWYAYPEGTFQRLDGGTLDLGVVRDGTYNAVNAYETFVEVFEAIAKRGTESLQVISTLRPNGASAAGVVTATSPVVY